MLGRPVHPAWVRAGMLDIHSRCSLGVPSVGNPYSLRCLDTCFTTCIAHADTAAQKSTTGMGPASTTSRTSRRPVCFWWRKMTPSWAGCPLRSAAPTQTLFWQSQQGGRPAPGENQQCNSVSKRSEHHVQIDTCLQWSEDFTNLESGGESVLWCSGQISAPADQFSKFCIHVPADEGLLHCNAHPSLLD